MGKSLLWQMFSIDQINNNLKEISPDPLAYADFSLDLPPTTNMLKTPSASTEPIIFNFGMKPVGYKPTVISVALKNVGVVPVDWIFHFPNDLEVTTSNANLRWT
jgi:hypothetical protein